MLKVHHAEAITIWTGPRNMVADCSKQRNRHNQHAGTKRPYRRHYQGSKSTIIHRRKPQQFIVKNSLVTNRYVSYQGAINLAIQLTPHGCD